MLRIERDLFLSERRAARDEMKWDEMRDHMTWFSRVAPKIISYIKRMKWKKEKKGNKSERERGKSKKKEKQNNNWKKRRKKEEEEKLPFLFTCHL